MTSRIAVVHDWLRRWAGSEQVLEQILRCFPTADLFCLTSCPDEVGRSRLADRPIRTSFLQQVPLAARWPQLFVSWLPMAAEQLDLRGYDLVISNSHCAAKGVIAAPAAKHLAYIHSPPRYAWDLHGAYTSRVPWLLRPLWMRRMHRLRQWDALSALRPDALACNSHYIARRIARAWRREAAVLYPPIDLEVFTPGSDSARDDVFVTASRLVGYKQVPLIAGAFAAMPGRRLRIIGDGPDLGRIRAIARQAPNIAVLGHLPRERLVEELRRARAFVFAAEEDFGIAPVEAMACGTPVIAFARGGAAETVVPGTTGRWFHEQTPQALIESVEAFCAGPAPDPAACRARAMAFSPARFRAGLMALVAQLQEGA